MDNVRRIEELCPELVLNSAAVPYVAGYGRLFTFKNGKVKRLGSVETDNDKFCYYKKTGVYIAHYVMGGYMDSYYKLQKGKIALKFQKNVRLLESSNETSYYKGKKKISKSQFNREVKKLVKGKKKTSAKFYKNTAANRKNTVSKTQDVNLFYE